MVPAAYDSGQPLNNDTFIRIDGQTLEIEEEVDVGLIRSRQDGSYLVLEAEGEAWAVIFDDTLTTLVQLSDY